MKNPHAQALGRLGGRKKDAKMSDATKAHMSAGQRRRWARVHDAQRVMALAADEHGAMLAARRTIDEHAPRALARDGGTRELPHSTNPGEVAP